jgi:hypothetical protein
MNLSSKLNMNNTKYEDKKKSRQCIYYDLLYNLN